MAMAEQLNTSNGYALRTIALMATAIENDLALDELSDDQKDIMAHFKNPAMTSVAATADAAVKIAGSREYFADTDTFLEMIGFDKAEIRRIKAEERKLRGLATLEEMEEEAAMEEEEEFEEDEDIFAAFETGEEELDLEEDLEETEGTEDTAELNELIAQLQKMLEELG